MPYVKKTVTAGRSITVRKFFTSRYNNKSLEQKSCRRAPSTEQMEEINLKNAQMKLEGLLNSNFKMGDLHIQLTYKKELRPASEQEAKDNLRKFKRELRKKFKEAGAVLKYICVTEHPDTSIHHHFIIPRIDTYEVQKCWPFGKVRYVHLDTYTYEDLAQYLVKETKVTFRGSGISAKRWESSRNLVKPDVEYEIIKRDFWAEDPVVPDGYFLKRGSFYNGVTDDGYAYQQYQLVRYKNEPKIKSKWRYAKNGK